ncbi:hypothetical protein JCM16358_16670 [Halanaerocella petrolearia]
MENKNLSKGQKVVRGLIFLFLLVVPILVIINFYHGYRELQKMDQEIVALKSEIKQLKKEKKELRTKVKQVNSKDFVENIARQKLGLVKKGEVLYITVEK